MGKQGILPIKLVSYRIFLVRAQGNIRRHSRKGQVGTVVFPWAVGIKQLIILLTENLPALSIPENPVFKCLPDRLLFLTCQGGFLFVEYPFLRTVFLSPCQRYGCHVNLRNLPESYRHWHDRCRRWFQSEGFRCLLLFPFTYHCPVTLEYCTSICFPRTFHSGVSKHFHL